MFNSQRPAIAGLALAALLSSLGTSIANVALPTLAHAFGASVREVQWVVLAYLLATTSLVVGAGWLGDRVGRRELLLAGIALFTASSVIAAVAPSLTLLIAARFAQGAGAAVMLALAVALISDAVPHDQVGRAMGVLGSMSAVGTALGPSLGGMLVAWQGWRTIFLVTVPIGLLAFVLVRAYLPQQRSPGPPVAGRPEFRTLREKPLRAALLSSASVAAVVMATLVVGPFYLSQALALEAAAAGMVMSVGPIVAAAFGIPAGRITDRLGAQRATVAGIVGMTVGSATLSAMPVSAGVPAYLGAVAVVTAGYALFQTANNSAAMANVAATDRGMMAGLLSLSRNVGLLSGAAGLGAVYAFVSDEAGSQRAAAAAAGLHATFGVAVILLLVALLAVVRWRSTHEHSAVRARSAMPRAPVA
jgi:MFS family permease